jgi:pimeloyl-ACP methyl ester carboxylesterase
MAKSGRRRAGLLGAAVGVVAAGTAVGIAVERYTIGRSVRQLALSHDPGPTDGSGPFGSLRGRPRTVRTDDGVVLYVEVDEPAEPAAREAASDRPTLVFVHGYTLNQDSWHFQRAALRETYRCVFYDQRGHGRSGRGSTASSTIDQLGRDLHTVLRAVCPSGDVVLIGHSMGGMTVMALADSHPELFRARRGAAAGPRVVGVALISTSAGRFADITLGLPTAGAKLLHSAAPSVLRVLGTQVRLVERGRRAGADIALLLTRRYSFGSEVSPSVARFTSDMIEGTPIDVIAEFFPTFGSHDKLAALPAMAGIPTLVLVGDHDLLTPPAQSRVVAEALPGARFVEVPDAGHVVLLEHPDVVSDALRTLLVDVDGYVASLGRNGRRGGHDKHAKHDRHDRHDKHESDERETR